MMCNGSTRTRFLTYVAFLAGLLIALGGCSPAPEVSIVIPPEPEVKLEPGDSIPLEAQVTKGEAVQFEWTAECLQADDDECQQVLKSKEGETNFITAPDRSGEQIIVSVVAVDSQERKSEKDTKTVEVVTSTATEPTEEPTEEPSKEPTEFPVTDTPAPSPSPTSAFTGKVCQIKSGWDTNTIFLRQLEFDTLGLPIGTRVTVAVLDTRKTVENVTLSLDSSVEICSVRLSKLLRKALDVNDDVAIDPVSDRPDRQFDITSTSPPINEEVTNFQGKVCMVEEDQDTKTIFLRQAEFDAFEVPAGTTVSVIVLDTEKTVEKITLSLDSSLATCTVRLPESYREALDVASDTDIQPPENRPDRRISIRLPKPSEPTTEPPVTDTPTLTPPIVRSTPLALITFHGRYVTAMNDEDSRDWKLRAETTELKDWEKFILLCLDNGKVALKTFHGRYVTAMDDQPGYDWELRAETKTLSDWEKFKLVEADTGEQLPCLEAFELFGQGSVRIALETFHGRYVTAMNDEGNRDWVLRAETRTLSDWEKFTTEQPIIELDPDDFKIQPSGDGEEEFILDLRFQGPAVQGGVDLSDYDLEFTFQGGDGREVQLWYKDQRWANVFSCSYIFTSDKPIRFNPVADRRCVDEFDEFTHTYAVGAKVFGGVEGVEITSARLISR